MNRSYIVFVLWTAAAVFVCGPVSAEILVLKDGTLIHCRVLLRDADSVTIRDAQGNEMMYQLKDIDRIDPALSQVEVYESVAELISPDSGALAYYLAVWLQEQDIKRPADVERLLAIASRGPAWRGRSLFEMSRLSKDENQKRSYVLQALTLDPCMASAAKAAARSGDSGDRLPSELLRTLADGIQDVVSGRYVDALNKVKAVSGHRDQGELSATSLRLREISGMSIAELEEKCTLAAEHARESGHVEETTPTSDCAVCGGTGHVNCDVCRNGIQDCKSCEGNGTISGKKAATWLCRECRGFGGKNCSRCLRRPDGAVQETRTATVMTACGVCKGEGVLETKRLSNRGLVASRSTKQCVKCSGRGAIPRNQQVSVNITMSGTRRCMKCNAGGKIPPPWQDDSRASENRDRRKATRLQTPAEIFGPTAVLRLAEFAGLAQDAANGNAGYRWSAGATVSVYQTEQAIGPSDDLVFVTGKWMQPKRVSGAKRRVEMLMHNPRVVDLSGFASWVEKHEMAYTKDGAMKLGSGKDAASEITGIASLYGRGTELRHMSRFDTSRIYSTTFDAASGQQDEDELCAYTIPESVGRSKLEIIFLRQPGSWPKTTIHGRIVPGHALNPSDIADALRSERELRDCSLEFRYRLKGCSRLVEGTDDEIKIDYTLEIEPLVVIARKDTKTLRIWTVGTDLLRARKM